MDEKKTNIRLDDPSFEWNDGKEKEREVISSLAGTDTKAAPAEPAAETVVEALPHGTPSAENPAADTLIHEVDLEKLPAPSYDAADEAKLEGSDRPAHAVPDKIGRAHV